MLLEQTPAEDIAIDSLREAASALVALDAAPRNGDFMRTVERAVDRLCRAIERCERAGIDKRQILAHLDPARAIHRRSPFIARAQDWPRGYAGDFETIEYLCAAANHAEPGSLGHALEHLALRSPITGQHRNKLAFQANAMLAACARKKHARILSIGCGGCRDIRAVAEPLLETSAEFVLCDLDDQALDFSLRALGPLAERCTYLNATLPRVVPKLVPYGPFDLVIGGGVFDYLPDRWVTLSARNIWHTLLAPKGEFVFTNIKRGNAFRVWLEYLANWELRERDEVDVVRCCTQAGIPASAIDIQEDGTGLALLITCGRQD